jgi:hypothetical protein
MDVEVERVTEMAKSVSVWKNRRLEHE